MQRCIGVLVILVFGVGLPGVWAGEAAPKAVPATSPKPTLPYKTGVTLEQTGAFSDPPKMTWPGFEAVMKDANRREGVNGHL